MKEETKNLTQSKISRRKFIEGAAASAFTFTVMKPALAFGTEANSKIEAGVIGLGWRGSWLTDLLVNHGGYKIAAVADYFDEVVQAAGDRFGVPKEKRFSGLSGYKKLIASGVDAVFHETPPYCFPEHVKASVDAGKHVYMAKPLGCDVPGCLSIAQSAKKAKENKKVFLVDFQARTDPFYIEGIKRVQNGEIGKPVLLNSIYTDEGFEDPPKTKTIESRLRFLMWVNDNDLGGGYLVNAGIHAVDVALWIAGGQPVSAVGSSCIGAEKPNGDSHRIFSVTYQYAKGLIHNHWGEHLKNRMEFTSQCFAYCQDGYLETQYTGQVRMLGIKTGYGGGNVGDLYRSGAERNIAAFHKSILNSDFSNSTVTPSVDSTLAVILGREAAARNTKLTMEQVLKENKKLEVDLSGLKE